MTRAITLLLALLFDARPADARPLGLAAPSLASSSLDELYEDGTQQDPMTWTVTPTVTGATQLRHRRALRWYGHLLPLLTVLFTSRMHTHPTLWPSFCHHPGTPLPLDDPRHPSPPSRHPLR